MTDAEVLSADPGFTFEETIKGISNNTIPGSLVFYQINGRVPTGNAVQQGNKFQEQPFNWRSDVWIVTEREILRVYED